MKALRTAVLAAAAVILAACSGQQEKAQPESILQICEDTAKRVSASPGEKNFSDAIDVLGRALDTLAVSPTPQLLNAAAGLMQALDSNEANFSDATSRKYWNLTQKWNADSARQQVLINVQQTTLTLGMTPEDIEAMAEETTLANPASASDPVAIDDPTANE